MPTTASQAERERDRDGWSRAAR
uniref:Uncharacterized protein n=1 Tax=Rhizophora mucronata TaxID=61149 RepID=A0A2P2IM85_RHIMU